MNMQDQQTPNYYTALHADKVYHVFNRTNNRELLFRTDGDREFFLKRYLLFISPFVNSYAYCLLPNHFHFMIKVKSLEDIASYIESLKPANRTKSQIVFLASPLADRTACKVLEHQFLRLFTSYAIVFNDRHKRKGNLFHRPFKRLEVQNEDHFTHLIYYIHSNPKKHKITSDFANYSWSSFRAFLSDEPTYLLRENVLEWFGGREAFIQFHQLKENFEQIYRLAIEEDGK